MLLAADRGAATQGTFSATCTISESVGDFVRATSGGGPTVAAVDIDATPTEVAIGIIINKPTATTCLVQRSGTVTLGGLTAGANYFVGLASTATAPRPAAPGSGKRTIQIVGQALTSTLLALAISPRVTRIIP